MKRYKVFYSDFNSRRIVANCQTKDDAYDLCRLYNSKETFDVFFEVVEHEEFNIREERLKKLERINKISQMLNEKI